MSHGVPPGPPFVDAPFLNSISHVQLLLPYRRRSSRQRQTNVKALLQIDGIPNLRRGCSPAYPTKLPTRWADQSPLLR